MKNLIALLTVCTSLFAGAQSVKNVDAKVFNSLIGTPKTVLLDLRTTDEIKNKGMIKGAKQLDFLAKDSEEQIKKLDKKKTYLIHCASGGRSGDCAELMKMLGFVSVINLEKGFDDWKKKGFEIEKRSN